MDAAAQFPSWAIDRLYNPWYTDTIQSKEVLTVTRKPSFTPLEAVAMFGDDRGQTLQREIWTLTMDGPMMSPSWAWAPQANDPVTGETWFCDGEPGDGITEKTEWVGPY